MNAAVCPVLKLRGTPRERGRAHGEAAREMIRGLAEGSGVPFREILSLNTFIDLADMVRPETAHNYFLFATNGCTAFGAMPPATRDGNVYPGQTFDTKAVFEPVEPPVYSLCRGSPAQGLPEARAGEIDAAVPAEVAADHTGAEDTICSHVDADPPRLRRYKTDFAVILDPKRRAPDVFVGSPCENKKMRLETGD